MPILPAYDRQTSRFESLMFATLGLSGLAVILMSFLTSHREPHIRHGRTAPVTHYKIAPLHPFSPRATVTVATNSTPATQQTRLTSDTNLSGLRKDFPGRIVLRAHEPVKKTGRIIKG